MVLHICVFHKCGYPKILVYGWGRLWNYRDTRGTFRIIHYNCEWFQLFGIFPKFFFRICFRCFFASSWVFWMFKFVFLNCWDCFELLGTVWIYLELFGFFAELFGSFFGDLFVFVLIVWTLFGFVDCFFFGTLWEFLKLFRNVLELFGFVWDLFFLRV